ncbi:long-chain fatty acid--CoA ligase [Paucibacter sp. PLA-PC-4]|uniref:long-chain fatty acid--CoA ligase n=1 Tax=Paucibacter sp. PLA-PC-4 TaxID=2993655 RepID=UPI002248C52C|nr:long-chain fatty acid--CoA ligase [Paucibacter sp. PLA-PC-4]MCX2863219.1 long-chain fatty acid--CoA ligase [Paucibacter sp. PLA-PC-4]
MTAADPPVPHTRQHVSWPRRLPRLLEIPRTSLWFNLEVAATRYPDKAATLFCGRSMTYAELRRQAEALAGWLQAQGVGKGDRVALFMQNCPQFLIAFYAINRADAVVVPVNPMNRAEEFSHYISDPETRVVICSADLAAVVDAANAALPPDRRLKALLVTRYAQALPDAGVDAELALAPALQQWLMADPTLPAGASRWTEALEAGLVPGPHSVGPDDLALLPYTSGTTGLPKGCMHSNGTLMANACGGGLWGYASPESVGLAVVPMFHITGLLYGVLGPIYQGMSLVIMPRWDRELAGRLISRHKVTHWTCIPTMIIDLFGSPNYQSFDLGSLIYLSGGGAAMPQAVAERLRAEFGLTFAEGYGLTETAAPTHANPPERAKLQCLGIPIFGVDSRVVDPVTLQEMPLGEVGEIISHGPMVFKGYWRQPEATAAAFVEIDGKRFFRTGDLGRMDEEGYFFITDRLKRMINASGYKVWPSEVEMLLYKHPAVQEACIIAARDTYRGETVKAVVVLRAGAEATTAEDLIGWAREHMAPYKAPRLVEFVASLPKSGSGKVMWRLLQEQERR